MIRSIYLFILFFISLNSFSQTTCESGIFSFKQENEKLTLVLVKNGEVLPARNLDINIIYSRMFSFLKKYENETLLDNNLVFEVESKLLKTKSNIIICYDSFIEQITPFLKGEIKKVVLNSQKGIPFLTFTKTGEKKLCKDSKFISYKNNDKTYHIALIANGVILPTDLNNSIFQADKFLDNFEFDVIRDTDDLIIIKNIKSDKFIKVRIDFIKSEIEIMLCLERFEENLKIYFDSDLIQKTFNSSCGTPFLTFTKVE